LIIFDFLARDFSGLVAHSPHEDFCARNWRT
jgi:hypothetical protein